MRDLEVQIGKLTDRWSLVCSFVLAALVFSPLAHAQGSAGIPTPEPVACPVEFLSFNPALSIRLKNATEKMIVGLVFNVALADAAEHWTWLRWLNVDPTRLRQFGWNKRISSGATKTLSWDHADLDFTHGGGGAFVLTSILWEDGSRWDEPEDSASCAYIWYNTHKKSFARGVQLPIRR